MEYNVDFQTEGETLTVRLHGELDHHAAKPMREAIDRRVFSQVPGKVVLDFSDVPFMDSSGIGLIFGRAEVCHHTHASLVVSGLSGELSRIAKLSGLGKVAGVTLETPNKDKKERTIL